MMRHDFVMIRHCLIGSLVILAACNGSGTTAGAPDSPDGTQSGTGSDAGAGGSTTGTTGTTGTGPSVTGTGGQGQGGDQGSIDNGAPGSLSVSTHSLIFSAASTENTPASQTVTATVTGVKSGTLYVKVVSSGPAVASVSTPSITSSTTGSATVYPTSAKTLGPGSFASTITISVCTTSPECSSGQLAGSPQTIEVTYTISGVTVSTSGLDYTIGNTPVPADYAHSFSISGYPSENWSAAVDVPWITVSPLSANAGAKVEVSAVLDQAKVDAMLNGVLTGTLTVSPPAGKMVTIPISLNVARTQVNDVAPYIGISGRVEDVIIRGEHFDAVAIQGVAFGGSAASSFQVVSATEIHATHPALTAGSYPVQLQTDAGTPRSLAKLVVIDPISYTPQALAYPDTTEKSVVGLVYDAERAALAVGVTTPSTPGAGQGILRYAYAGGWSPPTFQPFPNVAALALSTNGQQLLAGAKLTVTPLDPTTLAASVGAGNTTDLLDTIKGFGMANDGYAIALTTVEPAASGLSPVYRYDIRHPALTRFGEANYFWGTIGASSDGSRVLIGSGMAGADPIYVYNASTGMVSQTGIRYDIKFLGLDRTGSRLLVGVQGQTRSDGKDKYIAYDGAYAMLGALPSTTRAAILSPDGLRAYAYESSASGGTIRTFDTSAIATAGDGLLPELGAAMPLPGDPSSDGMFVRMAISPDGGTLFLAGKSTAVVVPLPAP